MNPPTQTGAAPSKPKRGITSPSRRGGSGRVLTDVLVDLCFVEREVMDDAIAKAQSAGSAAERVLLTQGAITDDQLARAVAERFGLDHVALRNYKVDPDAAKLVTPAAVKRYQAVPVSFVSERTLLVAMADPANVLAVDDIAVMTGYEVRPAVASGSDIEWLLERLEDPEYAAVLLDLDDEEEVEVPDPSAARPETNAGPLYDIREQDGRSTSAPRARTPRSSSSCTASSPRRSTAASPTSTSSRRTATCASATASTACSATRRSSRRTPCRRSPRA